MGFQENLRRCREAAGFSSARAFADHIGVPYTTYISYENKKREPKYDTLCMIAAKLATSPNELLGYEPNKKDNYIRIVEDAGFSVEIDKNGIITLCDNDSLIGNCACFNENEFIGMVATVLKELREQSRPALYDKIYKKMLEQDDKERESFRKNGDKLRALYPEIFSPTNTNNS